MIPGKQQHGGTRPNHHARAGETSVNWEVFRVVKDRSLTALTALNAFRRPSCFTDEREVMMLSVGGAYEAAF
jgi:hypothetical protein